MILKVNLKLIETICPHKSIFQNKTPNQLTYLINLFLFTLFLPLTARALTNPQTKRALIKSDLLPILSQTHSPNPFRWLLGLIHAETRITKPKFANSLQINIWADVFLVFCYLDFAVVAGVAWKCFRLAKLLVVHAVPPQGSPDPAGLAQDIRLGSVFYGFDVFWWGLSAVADERRLVGMEVAGDLV